MSSSRARRPHRADRADFEPTEEQKRAAGKLIDLVDRYGLHTPAIMALEMGKPLNRVASTMFLLGAPSERFLLGTDALQELGVMLDDRRALEYLLRTIEERA